MLLVPRVESGTRQEAVKGKGMDPKSQWQEGRSCGPCDLCCTVLRVDELRKLGGIRCDEQQVDPPGCGIYDSRPGICRAYRCLWLRGGLEEADRPDRTGAVVDLVTTQGPAFLAIRELLPGAYEKSPRLHAIAERFRETLPVRVTSALDAMDADRLYRVLLADGLEHRVIGEWTRILRNGREVAHFRIPLLERLARRWGLGFRRLMLILKRTKTS